MKQILEDFLEEKVFLLRNARVITHKLSHILLAEVDEIIRTETFK